MDAVKEKYYPLGNYDDQYMRWTTLHQERGKIVLELKNTFHTLHTKIGIKYYERHIVIKYHRALHMYIQTEIEFLDISSLGATYRYVVKIEKKFKQHNKWEYLSLKNHNNQSMVKETIIHRISNLKTTSPSYRKRRATGRRRRTLGSGVTSTKYLGTTPMNVTRNNHW
jgi:hypothetical protein